MHARTAHPPAALVGLAWLLFAGPLAAADLDCPTGAAPVGKAPPGGIKQWCALPDGVQHGPSVVWDPDGQRRVEAQFAHGRLEGVYRTWHPNGQLRFEERYQDDVKDGPAVSYFSNGQKQAEGRFEDGAYDGTWSSWHADGRPEKVVEFDHGEKVREEIFASE